MPYQIRPFDRDFAGIVRLLNEINANPVSVEQLEQAHANFPPDGLRHRTVALSADGTIIGYANTFFRSEHRPGRFYVTLVTAPEARRQGVGTALLSEAEEWARASGAKELLTSLTDEDEEAVQFGLHRGFDVEYYTLTNRLDLERFGESAFPRAVDAVREAGIRFSTYPEEAGEESKRKVYELYKVTDLDTPGYIGTDPALYPPYERWHAEIFENPATLPEGIIIAYDGEQPVGLTIL